MSVIVQKYGGSSVADVERIRKVAARVSARRAEGHQLVVVVSAMGDTTDELLSLAKRMSADPPRRELDMLLTCGERISMALLSMALHELGVPAISFTGSQSGIITDDNHAQARIVEVRPVRIREELAKGKVVIVAGYQGVSRNREVTTLGRGGSDTTAVALAAALGAEACEIYSDVDGVFSADPRVVPEARKLEALDYGTMQELAAAGARVLNAQAVEFARAAGIVIEARSTHGGGHRLAHRPGPGAGAGGGQRHRGAGARGAGRPARGRARATRRGRDPHPPRRRDARRGRAAAPGGSAAGRARGRVIRRRRCVRSEPSHARARDGHPRRSRAWEPTARCSPGASGPRPPSASRSGRCTAPRSS